MHEKVGVTKCQFVRPSPYNSSACSETIKSWILASTSEGQAFFCV